MQSRHLSVGLVMGFSEHSYFSVLWIERKRLFYDDLN
jgi:hypothetical protein